MAWPGDGRRRSEPGGVFGYSSEAPGRIIAGMTQRAAYRIIDANFNRAREAARVIEEYCRFALDCEPLTARAKKLRHDLCTAMAGLDGAALIAARDTPGDVGVGMAVQGQLQRGDLRDCLTAGCKRLPEALRAITEAVQSDHPTIAAAVERLRYDAYTLEKDIVTFADPAGRFARVRLYVLISSDLPAEVLWLTQSCVAGGADCLQLRTKHSSDEERLALARKFAAVCAEGGVLSIVNDRADIAVLAGADGVHLGRGDIGIEEARRLQSRPLIIGATTHNLEELRAVSGQQPTYVSLGPVWPTETKPDLDSTGLDHLRRSLEALECAGIAHVAIGGITQDNVGQVLGAGARAVAVCAAVTRARNPEAACRSMKQRIEALLGDPPAP